MATTPARPPSSAWADRTNATAAWTELRNDARTREERACIAAATRHADRVWVALHNGSLGPGKPTSPIPPRDPAWHRLALSAYELHRQSGAYRHLAQLRPWACAASEPVLLAWLDSAALPEQTTVAQRLGVGDAVHLINGDTQVAHLSTLLNAAQDAAVFGVPGHRVELVTAVGHHDGGSVVRVVVDAPNGLALASEPVELDVLVGADTSSVASAVASLREVADVATRLFTVYANAVWVAPPPAPVPDRAATAAGRAFPELDLHSDPTPPSSQAAPPRAGTADADRTGRSR